ncbi:MAG TPA: hypothetical protein VFH82_06080 [Gemmatimonadota bacterium]|jgi:hypothetical protein|nr:hypothetical protein [Gemmatimonadota bacterium]
MRSGEARPARRRNEQRDLVQGSLEGILPPDESGTDEKEAIDASKPLVKKRPGRVRDNDDGKGADALRASLDALEENITLLLAQHESLTAHAADEERRRSQGGLDPIELDRRIRSLEADKERLARHSAFLEERIRGLLSRVRYVIES